MLDAIGRGVGAALDWMNTRDNRAAANANALENTRLQTQFAKNAIRWKVADAKRAGIHPLYAMGAPTMSFSPVSIGDQASTNFASTFGAMGADLSTAFGMGTSKAGKTGIAAQTASELGLENMRLQNDLLRTKLASDVAKMSQPGVSSPDTSAEGVKVTLPVDKMDKVTPLAAGGTVLHRNRGWSDGQTFEDRWGEWGGGAAGLAVMLADLAKTLRETQWAKVEKAPFSWKPSFNIRWK